MSQLYVHVGRCFTEGVTPFLLSSTTWLFAPGTTIAIASVPFESALAVKSTACLSTRPF